MSYNPKTNWQDSEIVHAVDMNRIEQGISDLDTGKQNLTKNLGSKASIVDADFIPLADSDSQNIGKKVTFSIIKSTLKTYFDALYTMAKLNLTGYSKAASISEIAATDTVNEAFGKVAKTLDDKAKTDLSNVPNEVFNDKAASSGVVTEAELNSRTENLYNPNLLVNCDDFSLSNVAYIDSTNTSSHFNVTLNNMIYWGSGFAPLTVESSGDIEMRYQITGSLSVGAERLPMTLQVRFGAREGSDVTTKTYVFNEPDDEFTETMGSVTWRITLTGYFVKIYWTKAANVESDYVLAGAKLELGNVPTRYDISNTLGKTIDLVWQESKNTFEKTSNKVTSVSNESTHEEYPSAKAVYDTFEKASNKVTGWITSSSTDDEYPSAKAVYKRLDVLLGGDATAWKYGENGVAKWYFYESESTLTYDLPVANCIIIVFRKTATRGVAFAFGWDGVSTNKTIWKNTNHDGWKGWTQLHSN